MYSERLLSYRGLPMMLTRTSLLLSLFWLSCLANGRVVQAQNFSTVTINFGPTANVSDRFQRETEAATRSVPPQVWQTLDEAGWRIQLAEFVVDAAPALRGVRPNGWPRHLTWDNSDAIHLPTSKLLILAEKRRNRAGEIVASSRVAGVLRHEIGHAFDMAVRQNMQSLSASPQFVQAYEWDRSHVAPRDRGSLGYYLQDSRSGLQETFAEAFAAVLGGGSSDIEPEAFEAHFPRVTAFARRAIRDPAASRVVATPSRGVRQTTVRRRFIRRR